MLGELRECARGATIVSINPLRERGWNALPARSTDRNADHVQHADQLHVHPAALGGDSR
jgi:hypothetical protein